MVGLTTLLWEQSRHDLLRSTLFIMDGPMAVYGPPAKLRGRAVTYFQQMIGDNTRGWALPVRRREKRDCLRLRDRARPTRRAQTRRPARHRRRGTGRRHQRE